MFASDPHSEPTWNLRKKALQQRRQALLAVFSCQCAYCGSPDPATLDHVVPRFRGGPDQYNNLVPCCPRCNKSKGSRDWVEWYRERPWWDPDREQEIHRHLSKNYSGVSQVT